jgi:predicted phosphodiesterase
MTITSYSQSFDNQQVSVMIGAGDWTMEDDIQEALTAFQVWQDSQLEST